MLEVLIFEAPDGYVGSCTWDGTVVHFTTERAEQLCPAMLAVPDTNPDIDAPVNAVTAARGERYVRALPHALRAAPYVFADGPHPPDAVAITRARITADYQAAGIFR